MKLTVYLIKEGLRPDQAIKAGYNTVQVDGHTLYYKDVSTNRPKWASDFFLGHIDNLNFITAVPSALLLVETQERLFCITFGMGFSFLNDSAIEKDFGIITALNVIEPESIRTIDIDRMDDNPTKNRTQISKISSIDDFGIDINRILMKSITGIVSERYSSGLGKTVTGNQSFHVSPSNISILNISHLLNTCYVAYNNGNLCNQDFAWIKNISAIKDISLQQRLYEEMLDDINRDDCERTYYFSIPDIVDWSTISYLRIGNKDLEFNVNLENDVFPALKIRGPIDLNILKNKKISAFKDDGSKYKHWSLLDCIYTEKPEGDKLYILHDGSWFEINHDYVQELQSFYDNVPLYDGQMSTLKKTRRAIIRSGRNNQVEAYETEGDYNKRMSRENHFELGDRQIIKINSRQAPVEVCDLYKKGSRKSKSLFFHVKLGNSSATISHLFNQGLVSGELMKDKSFREKAHEKIPNIVTQRMVENYKSSNFEIIFVLVSNKATNSRPDIPFFSKISFRNVYSYLTKFGYTVRLKWVGLDEN